VYIKSTFDGLQFTPLLNAPIFQLSFQINNKSSDFDQTLNTPRTSGSYIYESYLRPDNSSDVKVYTVGPEYAHAEGRKSPTVDGRVDRCKDGKEVRHITELTGEEKEISRRIVKIFAQWICGFDLLRVKEKSYVIDVNGWSFVKGSEGYYEACAKLIRKLILERGMRDERKNHIDKYITAAATVGTLTKDIITAGALTENATFEEPESRVRLNEEDTLSIEHSKLLHASAPRPSSRASSIPDFFNILTGHAFSFLVRTKQSLSILFDLTARIIKRGYDDVGRLMKLNVVVPKKMTATHSVTICDGKRMGEYGSYACHKVKNAASVGYKEVGETMRTVEVWRDGIEITQEEGLEEFTFFPKTRHDRNDKTCKEKVTLGQKIADNNTDHDNGKDKNIIGQNYNHYEYSEHELYESQIAEMSCSQMSTSSLTRIGTTITQSSTAAF
jgi:hypothetical protein